MRPALTERVTVETVPSRLPDGVTLVADVYRAEPVRSRPALLARTPYSRAETAARIDAVRLARAGWLVVVQSVRGTGESGGRLDPFVQEEADGAAAVAWCRRLPGCDGRVAMTGASYEGITQWYAAGRRPAGLRAIFPRVCARSIRDVWFRSGGVLRHSFIQSWTLGLVYADQNLDERQQALAHELADMRQVLYELPPRQSPLSALAAYYDHWLESGDTAYWKQLEPTGAEHLTETAVLQLTGWYDIFCEGALDDYTAVHAPKTAGETSAAPRRIIVGPWSHTSLPDQVTGSEDHGLVAHGGASDVMFEGHAWLRAALDGEDCDQGARVFLVRGRRWLDLATWPPPSRSAAFRLLRVDGHTDTGPRDNADAEADQVIRLTGEPTRLERTEGGRTLDPLHPRSGPAIPPDGAFHRADVAAFHTAPFQDAVEAVGVFELELGVRAAHGVDAVIATLAVVDADGNWTTYVEGGIDLRDARHGPVRATVASFAVLVAAGERLGLVLSLSQTPAYWDGDPGGSGVPYSKRRLDLDPSPRLHVPVTGGETGPQPPLSRYRG